MAYPKYRSISVAGGIPPVASSTPGLPPLVTGAFDKSGNMATTNAKDVEQKYSECIQTMWVLCGDIAVYVCLTSS